jgi:hypothetical protein
VAKERLLTDWEQWSAELLESHVSYPMLGYFRSQHDNQSWLAALVSILDVCALTMTMLEDDPPFQAGLTFAMARHAVVDLRQSIHAQGKTSLPDRLPADKIDSLRGLLTDAGLRVRTDDASVAALAELREMYEPHAGALAQQLLMPLPPLVPERHPRPDWQVTAWDLPDWEDAGKRTGTRHGHPRWRRALRMFRRSRDAAAPAPELTDATYNVDETEEMPDGRPAEAPLEAPQAQEGGESRGARRR